MHSPPLILSHLLIHSENSAYEHHVNGLRAIISDQIPNSTFHVPFSPSDDPSPALGANEKVGVTELVVFSFPSTLTAGGKEGEMSSVDKMRPIMERSESLALYDGWAVEDDISSPGPQAAEGEKCLVL